MTPLVIVRDRIPANNTTKPVMQAKVLVTNASHEYFFEEGCYILELLNDPEDSEVSIARARVEPGETTQWHYLLDTTERYVVLQGEGVVEVGALEPQPVSAGDVVWIPPACPQRIRNCGDGELVFLAICTPRFQTENYRPGMP